MDRDHHGSRVEGSLGGWRLANKIAFRLMQRFHSLLLGVPERGVGAKQWNPIQAAVLQHGAFIALEPSANIVLFLPQKLFFRSRAAENL